MSDIEYSVITSDVVKSFDCTFTRASSVQGLPVILKLHHLHSLGKALDLLIEFKFCESDVYFLNGSKTCMLATHNFGSV